MATTSPAPDADFTQLLRGPSYAWWKPVLAIPLVAVFMLVVSLVALLVGAAFDPRGFVEAFSDYGSSSPTVTPSFLLALNLSLAAGIPAAWFCVRVVHGLAIGFASSVVGRIRWRLLGWYTGAAALTLLVTLGASFLLPEEVMSSGGAGGEVAGSTAGSTLAFVLVLLLSTPLQAAGEEYIFRGYLMQALGALGRSSWFAVLVTAAAFAAVHGQQNLPLLADRFAFGIVAGITVVVTGGLEAALAMHVLNNLLALGLALVTGELGSALTVSEVSWWNLPITLVQSLVFLALVVRITRAQDVAARTPRIGRAEARPVESTLG
ncbi:CPBP family intramembrane metalloprotease [Nocardioidaceae bacterium]|nr:CPBP family intramembrane metalloprotease [Nocardioidaceae bacterium]